MISGHREAFRGEGSKCQWHSWSYQENADGTVALRYSQVRSSFSQ